MLKGMSLNKKMLLAPVCLMLILALVGMIGYKALNQTYSQFGKLTTESIPNLKSANDMFLAYRYIRISLRTLGLTGITEKQEAQAVADVKAAIEAYEKADKEYTKIKLLPDEEALYEKVKTAWKEFKAVGAKVLALQERRSPEAKAEMLKIFFEDCPASATKFQTAMINLLDFHKNNAVTWSKEATLAAKAA